MKINTVGYRHWQIRHNGQIAGELHIPSLWSYRAQIRVGDRTVVTKRKLTWSFSHFTLTENGEPHGEIKIDWSGRGSIIYNDPVTGEPRNYIFKRPNLFSYNLTLLDEEGKQIILLKSHWSWRKFRMEYTVQRKGIFSPDLSEPILYALYASHIYVQNSGS